MHLLMDFNKAFTAYDSLEGAPCLTTAKKQSRKEAAFEAVKKVGLNRKKEIGADRFPNQKTAKMFFERLKLLEGQVK